MTIGKRLLLAVVVLLFALPAAAQVAGDCNSYSGVTPSHLDDFGYYCGGSGGGCTECVNFHPGGVEVCVYYNFWNIYCTDYGQEFQWP